MRLMLDDQYTTMPWEQIDSVVFDVGNVLLGWEEKQLLQDFLPDIPSLHQEIGRRVIRSPYWVMLDRGTLLPDEAVELMCKGAEELKPYISRLMHDWVQMDTVIEEGVNTLKKCKAHGKRLYVLSNYGSETFRVVDEKYDFFRLFDDKIISARVKMIKPEPSIYQLANERFGLNGERTLFIDDSHVNIEAALNAGWNGICFNKPGKLDAFFRD